ncbi:hypothetical protein D3OALGA1CA_56 [Olavius algarvensis associated proteobacterium Delta 3]|nr:hypothetical protein D3OALGA1CA_56 [Olavius algarvensis associated proteobacterium Delta 3]
MMCVLAAVTPGYNQILLQRACFRSRSIHALYEIELRVHGRSLSDDTLRIPTQRSGFILTIRQKQCKKRRKSFLLSGFYYRPDVGHS